MDLGQSPQPAESQNKQQPQTQTINRSSFATASISLSLSRIIKSKSLIPPKFQPSNHLSSIPTKVQIPSQAKSLSISSSSLNSPRSKPTSATYLSASPLHLPLAPTPRRPSHPSNAAALRRASLVWFRSDLRLHDNEALNSANTDSLSVLPVFVFDPNSLKSTTSNASFLIQAVSDLRSSLQCRGSDLIVRVGDVKSILVELAKAVGAEAVYAHSEISKTEIKTEQAVEAAMKEEGIEVKSFWGNTLYHVDDLPFDLDSMPTSYEGFRSKAGSLAVRKTIAALDQMKAKPARGDVEAGEIPTLKDLGLKESINGPIGGESEAQKRMRSVVAEFKAQAKKSGEGSVFGADFLSKLSPWLGAGCVSAKAVFEEIKQDGGGGGGIGMESVKSEMMWRDFFRFVTRKCSSGNRSGVAAPVAGALA